MDLSLKNVCLRAGDQLEIKGKILRHVKRFHVNLGSGPDDLALHFNPRFEETKGATIVCNSKAAGCWGNEKREANHHLERGAAFKLVFKITGDGFRVELPDGKEVDFPSRTGLKVFSYVAVGGDLQISSFAIR